MIKAVVFDVGGVLLRLDESKYYTRISNISGVSYDDVRKTLHSLEKYSYAGKMSAKEFSSAVASKLGIKKKEVGWLDFVKNNASVDKEVSELAFQLHRRYITGILTNADRSRYRYVVAHFKKEMHIDSFDYRFASCYMGIIKPSKRIFKYVVKHIGVVPGEVIFIDDHKENVDGARSIGMNSILFNNLHDNVNYLRAQIEKFTK